MPVSSVSLSETHIAGRPRGAMMASSSRATRRPLSDVSATKVRHSRVKSSTTARIRNRRPSAKASDRKSRLQRWLGPCGIVIGARVPSARLGAAAHLQPFLAIETTQLLVVHDVSLAARQDVQTAITEAAADSRQLAQTCPHGGIVRSAAAITDRGPVHPEHCARPPFAHLEEGP